MPTPVTRVERCAISHPAVPAQATPTTIQTRSTIPPKPSPSVMASDARM